MGKLVKLERLRNTPYKVNYVNEGMNRPYVWSGSRNGITDVKEVPEEVVNYLIMSTSCFTKGNLVIVEDSEEAKNLVENISDPDTYRENTHTRQEIIEILNSKITDMKKSLSSIEKDDEKKFVCDVAKEIKLDSASKRKYLSEWFGVAEEFLFNEEN